MSKNVAVIDVKGKIIAINVHVDDYELAPYEVLVIGFAYVGGTYDANADVFVAPQPYPSWSLDENHDWQPPTPKPEGYFYWDEANLEWASF